MRKETLGRVAALGAVLALGAAPAALAAGAPDSPGSLGLGVAAQHGQAANYLPGETGPGSHGPSSGQGQAGSHGNAGKAVVMYVFKGTYDGSGSVDVKSGNAHVRKANLVGTTVSFDLTNATFVVSDTNADGAKNADDVASGDRVVVKARLPRTDPGDQPFAAKQLVDQSHPSTSSGD
jgi:hypothetical protein